MIIERESADFSASRGLLSRNKKCKSNDKNYIRRKDDVLFTTI
jgi:hypothetical protein